MSALQTVRLPGRDLAFVDLAPTVDPVGTILLVHGFASNHAVNWVQTSWTRTLVGAGLRTVAFDNRGHGASQKFYRPEDYRTDVMADDARALLDHLRIERADVMGYSMGARITAALAVAHPERVRSALLGGLGIHLVEGVGLPVGIADAMEVESLDDLTDSTQRMFRAFAESTKSDLRALAACIRGSRQTLTREDVASLAMPVLVSVGTKDAVSGSGPDLVRLIPGAEGLDIPGRDHNLAVGDKVHKEGVLNFLRRRP